MIFFCFVFDFQKTNTLTVTGNHVQGDIEVLPDYIQEEMLSIKKKNISKALTIEDYILYRIMSLSNTMSLQQGIGLQVVDITKSDSQETDVAKFLTEKTAKEGDHVLSSWLKDTKSWMDKVESLEEMRDRVPELFSQLGAAQFAQLIEQANLLAHLEGIDSVE